MLRHPLLLTGFLALFALACTARPNTPSNRVEGTRVGDCSDGADNDADSFFDCEDQGCWGSPDCPGTGDDDDGAPDDDDTTPPPDDDDATPPADDDDTTPPADDDDTTPPADDDDSTPPADDDDATAGDDDDATAGWPAAGTCEPVGTISCGDSPNDDTSLPGVHSVIDNYACTTNNESGPEIVYELDVPAGTEVELYLTNFGIHELDILLMEDVGNGCEASACVQYANYYVQSFVTQPGATYYVAVDGFSGWAGPYELELTCAE